MNRPIRQNPSTVNQRHCITPLKRLCMVILLAVSVALSSAAPASAYNTNGQAAVDVVGQTLPNQSNNYASSVANNPMDAGLTAPKGVAIDAVRHLGYVADTGNNRVLAYTLNTDNSFPDYKADFVVGQAGFNTAKANRGTGSPQDNSLNQPGRVAVEQSTGTVYVSDTGNNRVLLFASVNANDPSASYVIGAANFTSTNSGGTVSQSRMLSPMGIAFSGTGVSLKVYIADKDFNRVLQFGQITANGQSAVRVLGQSSFVTSAPGLSQTGLAGPGGVAIDGNGRVYVADTGNSRVMVWTTAISSDGQACL